LRPERRLSIWSGPLRRRSNSPEHPSALTMGEEHGLKPQNSISPTHRWLLLCQRERRVLVQRRRRERRASLRPRRPNDSSPRAWSARQRPPPPSERSGRVANVRHHGSFPDGSDEGEDDLLTAQLIERARNGDLLMQCDCERGGRNALGLANPGEDSDHVHHLDVAYATEVDVLTLRWRWKGQQPISSDSTSHDPAKYGRNSISLPRSGHK